GRSNAVTDSLVLGQDPRGVVPSRSGNSTNLECAKTDIRKPNQRKQTRFDAGLNISLYRFSEVCSLAVIPPRAEGGYASSRTWRRAAMDVLVSPDERG